MNKLLVIMFLLMCIFGFSVSCVSAKSRTYHNVLELHKTYYFDHNGYNVYQTNCDLNMCSWDESYNDEKDTNVWGNHCYGYDLRYFGIVKASTYSGTYPGSKGIIVTPVVTGNYTTWTYHKFLGKQTYEWEIVDTGIKP